MLDSNASRSNPPLFLPPHLASLGSQFHPPLFPHLKGKHYAFHRSPNRHIRKLRLRFYNSITDWDGISLLHFVISSSIIHFDQLKVLLRHWIYNELRLEILFNEVNGSKIEFFLSMESHSTRCVQHEFGFIDVFGMCFSIQKKWLSQVLNGIFDLINF